MENPGFNQFWLGGMSSLRGLFRYGPQNGACAMRPRVKAQEEKRPVDADGIFFRCYELFCFGSSL